MKTLILIGLIGFMSFAHASSGQEALSLSMSCLKVNEKGKPVSGKIALEIFAQPQGDSIAVMRADSGNGYAAYNGVFKLDGTGGSFQSTHGDLSVRVSTERISSLVYKTQVVEVASNGQAMTSTVACVPNIR